MERGGFVSILESLGVDPEEFTWHDLALCGSIEDPDWFFEEYEKNTNVAESIDQMCLSCPVFAICNKEGFEQKRIGVWGAIYWNGNGKPDNARNAHKSPEVWEEIRGRLTE